MRVLASHLKYMGIAMLSLLWAAQGHATDYVGKAEAWFDKISTMQADFIQVASDSTTAEGELHLRRPHRMKIIYDIEEPLILLTTPVWLHVDRPDREDVTSYPISETPLSLILQDQVKLRSKEFETESISNDGVVSISLEKKTGQAAGKLILEFTEVPFELRRWTIRDAADITTTVTLQNMRYGHKYKNEFFAVSDYDNNR